MNTSGRKKREKGGRNVRKAKVDIGLLANKLNTSTSNYLLKISKNKETIYCQ